MSEEAKRIGEGIAKACNLLSEAKRNYFIGYADCAADMAREYGLSAQPAAAPDRAEREG